MVVNEAVEWMFSRGYHSISDTLMDNWLEMWIDKWTIMRFK